MSNSNNDETLPLVLETWKKSIDVQEHFNEICMKVRNFYISLVSALLALIGLIVSRITDPYFNIAFLEIHTAIPVVCAIMLSTMLFYFIDRHWYHRLLVGAVMNARGIEDKYHDKIPGLLLTTKIGIRSPLHVSEKGLGSSFWYFAGVLFGSDKRVRDKKEIHSDAKISIFYKSVAAIFFVVFVLICLGGGVRLSSEEPAPVDATSVSGSPR